MRTFASQHTANARNVRLCSDTIPCRLLSLLEKHLSPPSSTTESLFAIIHHNDSFPSTYQSGYATFRSGRSGLSRFGLETLRSEYEILQKSYMFTFFYANVLNQRKAEFPKTTNMIQDPAVNQHQHMIFIIISKQFKSLSTFCN